jgi:tRNA G10  N-methylase Trm11
MKLKGSRLKNKSPRPPFAKGEKRVGDLKLYKDLLQVNYTRGRRGGDLLDPFCQVEV